MTTEKKNIVIVGAGMAGLTAAAYLARENYSVLLLDKNDRYGGLLNTFEAEGFFFDAGARAFVNSGIIKPMLNDLGIEWTFLDNKVSIGIEDHMFRVDSMDSIAEYQRVLVDLYPESKADIDRIIAIIYKLSKHTSVLYEFDNPNFSNQLSDRKFVIRKLIPWTFKFLNALRTFNQFNMPMEGFLKRYTDNQSLIDIMTQFFFRNTPTHFALGYFYVYLDYFYPTGGTSALAKIVAKKAQESGVEIKLEKRIVAVNPAERTVTDSDGIRYAYDHLIWAADLKSLYRCVDPAGLDAKIADQIETETRRMLSARGAESVFILFAAVNRPPAWFKARGGEHLFYTPSRKGLGETNRAARQRLVAAFDSISKDEVLAWVEDYCNLNTFEVSIPVLRDPALAPEGQTGMMISCLLDYDIVEKIQEAGWYEEFKGILENRILNIFSETLYPGLAEDVLFKFSSSPLTLKQVSGSSEGAITGWSFETDVPVVSKLKDLPKSVLTAIPGVLQAGQWSYSPAGVPIAMITGWYAYKEILKRNKKG